MKQREKNIIIGIHPIKEALEANKPIDKVFFQKGERSDQIKELKGLLRERGIYCAEVPPEKIRKITHKPTQGVVGFSSPVEFYNLGNTLDEIYRKGESPFIMILDRVSDVRNFGAIVRSAEFFGVHAIVVPFRGSAAVNFDSIKTSAGAIFNIKICKEPHLENTVQFLQKCGLTTVAITEKANKRIDAPSIEKPLALVMGSEEDGITPEVLKACDMSLKIQGSGKTGSLNVAVAASIAMQQFA